MHFERFCLGPLYFQRPPVLFFCALNNTFLFVPVFLLLHFFLLESSLSLISLGSFFVALDQSLAPSLPGWPEYLLAAITHKCL